MLHRLIPTLTAAALLLGACATSDTVDAPDAPDAPGALVVYSGRNENLVGELFVAFTRTTGIAVEVRYGDTAELAIQILEEGQRSPADV
jgi:iron(III) transport system substrate-binding protein